MVGQYHSRSSARATASSLSGSYGNPWPRARDLTWKLTTFGLPTSYDIKQLRGHQCGTSSYKACDTSDASVGPTFWCTRRGNTQAVLRSPRLIPPFEGGSSPLPGGRDFIPNFLDPQANHTDRTHKITLCAGHRHRY